MYGSNISNNLTTPLSSMIAISRRLLEILDDAKAKGAQIIACAEYDRDKMHVVCLYLYLY